MLTQEERELYLTAFKGGYLPLWQFEQIMTAEYRLSQALQKAEEGLKNVYEATTDKIAVNIAHRTISEINRIKEGKP